MLENMEMIDDILYLTHDLYLIYLDLFRLEFSGNKGNERYLSLIKVLKDKISEEKELFRLLSQDRDSFNTLFSYVMKKPTQLLYLRMYSYMVFNNMDVSQYNEEDCEFEKIDSTCNIDLFLRYLSFLQDYIEDDDFVLIRKGLIYTKYYNSFINPNLEEYLVCKEFDVYGVSYVGTYFVSDRLLMDRKDMKIEMLDYYRDAIVVSMVNLLNSKDIDYNNQDKMVDIISSQCMFRASLSMLDDSLYESLKDGIYKIINELSTDDNDMSVRIINSIIDDRVKDRNRVRKINMKH